MCLHSPHEHGSLARIVHDAYIGANVEPRVAEGVSEHAVLFKMVDANGEVHWTPVNHVERVIVDPVHYHWQTHLADMGLSTAAQNNTGGGDCLVLAVRDCLRERGVTEVRDVWQLRTLVCNNMLSAPVSAVWRSAWNGAQAWEDLIRMADPSGHEYMWLPHIRALAVGLRRMIVRIPMAKGSSGEVEMFRVFHSDPNHGTEAHGVERPRGGSECCDCYTWGRFLAFWRVLERGTRDQTVVILYNGSDHYLGTSLRGPGDPY